MRQLHIILRIIPLLLAGAAIAACDQRTPDLPTGTRAEAGEAGLAPLMAAGRDSVPGRYVVVMQDGQVNTAAAVAHEVVAAHGGRVHHTYSAALNGFAASLAPAGVEALRRNPRVKYVEQDARFYLDQTTQPGATWGLDRIDQRSRTLNSTYVYNRTGAGVRVYVIDSGIRISHTEFGTRASHGEDLTEDFSDEDCNGHGTHVAGTIAGTTYGVAKAAQVIAVRVFSCSGGAELSVILAAVDWVTANAVKPAVVNMSLGGPLSSSLNAAVAHSTASGLVYVVAAGNESQNACNRSPSSAPEAITVGAFSSDDTRSWFSNWGTCVDLFAPGSAITSAWYSSDTAINTLDGTSMASSHAAGVAALYLQGNPTATPAAVTAALVTTASSGLQNPGVGSPNRLLFSLLKVPFPVSKAHLNPTALSFTVVRAAGGTATERLEGEVPRPFMGSGPSTPRKTLPDTRAEQEATTSQMLTHQVLLSNTGTTTLNWTAASNQPWLTADPAEGELNATFSAAVNASVNATGLALGTHTGTVTVSGGANGPISLHVTVNVVNALTLLMGTPRTGLSGAADSRTYYVLNVPVGAVSLTITTGGGTGDANMYVHYADVPTDSQWDCRSLADTNSEICQVSSPLPGAYYIMVEGYSDYSGLTLSAFTGGAPTAPTNVVARAASTTSIRLTWIDGSSETLFTVARRSQSSTGVWSAWANVASRPANATTFTNTGVVAGTHYQYRLRGCNDAGCSSWATSNSMVMPPSAPPTPAPVSGTPFSIRSIRVQWTDSSSTETSFTLERATVSSSGSVGTFEPLATLAPNQVLFNNTGLAVGTYQYRIRACNANGCSAWATTANMVIPPVPAAPPGLAATALSSTSIRLTWEDGPTETSYQVYRALRNLDGTWAAYVRAATPPANTVVYTSTGLLSGREYRYQVRACNVSGCSPVATSDVVTLP